MTYISNKLAAIMAMRTVALSHNLTRSIEQSLLYARNIEAKEIDRVEHDFGLSWIQIQEYLNSEDPERLINLKNFIEGCALNG